MGLPRPASLPTEPDCFERVAVADTDAEAALLDAALVKPRRVIAIRDLALDALGETRVTGL